MSFTAPIAGVSLKKCCALIRLESARYALRAPALRRTKRYQYFPQAVSLAVQLPLAAAVPVQAVLPEEGR